MYKKLLSSILIVFVFLTSGVAVSAAEIETETGTGNYYTDNFSESEQALYERVQSAVLSCLPSVTISAVNAERTGIIGKIGDTLLFYDAATWNLSKLTYTANGSNVTLRFSYYEDYDNYLLMQSELDIAVADITAAVSEKNVLGKLLYFHDYILSNCEYDVNSALSGSPYGVLIEGRGKCDGYSLAFQSLCEAADIPCVTVISAPEQNEFGHAWNKVKVSKSWYNIDCSSDDTALKWGDICYDWYMLADSEMGTAHAEWDDPFIIEPKAGNTKNSYYEMKKKSADSVAAAKAIIRAAFETGAAAFEAGAAAFEAGAATLEGNGTAATAIETGGEYYAAVEIPDKAVLEAFIAAYKAGKILDSSVITGNGTAEAFINPERNVVHIKVTV
jgi:hypothetical protein